MKILFIDPPYERLIGFKSEWFPLGLTYLASYLEKNGHDVCVYHGEHGQETVYKSIVNYSNSFNHYNAALQDNGHPIWAEIKALITNFQPDIIGLSVLTPKVPSASKIAEISKKINPRMVIVFGNHHPTIQPDAMFQDQNVDFLVRGEGEETFNELVRCLQVGQNGYERIRGLSFRKGAQIIHNSVRENIQDLDSLPFPARHRLYDIKSYTPVQLSMVITSRGCPYRCEFCSSQSMWGRRIRFRSINNVLKEIDELKVKYSVTNINFMDDSFTVSQRRLTEFCQALIDERINITWSCLTRVDIISDQMIQLMKKAGCTKVDVGIESGSQRILDLIKKDITLDRIRMATKILRRNKMFWAGFFMFGLPTETKEEVFGTLNFLKELKPNWACMSIFTPYPGTALYQLAHQKGMVSEPIDYTAYSHQNTQGRFTDTMPEKIFSELADYILQEVHRYNSSYRSLFKRALTRNYHRNPKLFIQDFKKVMNWLKR